MKKAHKKISPDLLDDISAGDILTIAHLNPDVENPVRQVKVTSTRLKEWGQVIFAKDDIARYRFEHGFCLGWRITAASAEAA